MFRKITWILLAMLCLTFCTLGEGSAQSKASPANLTIAGSSSTGTWFIYANAVSQMIRKYIPGVNASPTPSAGTPENLRNLGSGAVDIAMAIGDVTYNAYRGEGAWAGPKKMSNLRILYATHVAPLQIVAREGSVIRDIKDLKGKKIGTGTPGGGEKDMTVRVLEAYGLTEKDVNMVPLAVPERCAALGDGKIDCAFLFIGLTAAAMKELTITKDIRYIGLSDEALAALHKKYLYYMRGVIPANSFRLQTKDVPAMVMVSYLMTLDKFPEDLAYQIVRVTFEQKKELEELSPLAREFTIQSACANLPLPLHPGAEKYFKEKGLIK